MADNKLPILNMFLEMVREGHISPVAQMEDLRLPGAFAEVPSVIGYTTPEIPVRMGVLENAELGQRSERDINGSSDRK